LLWKVSSTVYLWSTVALTKIKLDICLVLMGFLGTVVKHIDQANLTNAYVSGMEEDLSLYGNVRFLLAIPAQ
jgi:hypothetical protein